MLSFVAAARCRAASADDPDGARAGGAHGRHAGRGERRPIGPRASRMRSRGSARSSTPRSDSDATVLSVLTLARLPRPASSSCWPTSCARPRLADEDFDRVRDLRLNRAAAAARPAAGASPIARSRGLLYPATRTGTCRSARRRACAAVTIDEVAAFHARAWRPSRMTLIAVGDADARRADGGGRARVRRLDARPATTSRRLRAARGDRRARAIGADRRDRAPGGRGAVRDAHRPGGRAAAHARLPRARSC